MKELAPIGIHCHVTPDRIVQPDAGYEAATAMEDQGYRGKARFHVLAGRTTEPPMVICEPVPREAEPVVIEYNPVINFAFFNWSYWHQPSGAWIAVAREAVFGVNGPAAAPNNDYHLDLGTVEDPPLTGNGLVDPFNTLIRSLAFTMYPPASPTNSGWKITSVNFFRWKGEPGNPVHYPYGVRNIKVPGVATVRFEIWKRTYTDVAFPGATFVDSFHEFKDYAVDASGGSIGDGVPAAITFSGFTNPQIDSFAQLAITDTWPQVVYGSGNLHVHYWIKSASFSVVP